MDYIDMKIEFIDGTKETTVALIEDKVKSVVVLIGERYAYEFDQNEVKYGKKPVIYIRNNVVKDYEQLHYENSYEFDDDLGVYICLFPRAKYEMCFDEGAG
jgi:hypothetical protein